MKVILHAGPHKTGTTAIQHYLAQNRQKLLAQGTYVSSILSPDKTPNNWFLIYLASRDDERSALYHNSQRAGRAPEECARFRSEYTEKLTNELREANNKSEGRSANQFILTTEEIVFLENDEINSLYAFLLKEADSIEVLYYYRSPIDRLRSDIQQASKGGTNITPDLLKKLPCQDYLRIKRLEPSDNLKQKVKIHIRAYQRSELNSYHWDACEDLCEAAAINTNNLDKIKTDKAINSSISLQMFSILRDVNRAMPTFDKDGKFNQFKRHFHMAVESYNWTPEDQQFKLSAQDIKALSDKKESYKQMLEYAESCNWINIDAKCWSVYEGIGKETPATGVEESVLTYTPSMSHTYYVNAICHFWSYLRKIDLRSKAKNPASDASI